MCMVSLVMLGGCYYNKGDNLEVDSVDRITDTRVKIEELPKDYSQAEAINDKCFVSIHGMTVYNKDELDTFLDKVNENEPYFLRYISYTIEGDMIITDIDFEGDNVFSTCFDWTRDNFANEKNRKYYYGKFTELVIEDNSEDTRVYLTNKLEGDLDSITVAYYNNNAKVINNYEFKYLLDIKRDDKYQLKNITEGELANKYDYDIYYYGLESCDIEINGERVDLIEALVNDKVTMEQIIEQAEKDSENGVIYSDTYKEGGTRIYGYGTYTIIKSHSLDGDGSVYIGIPEMTLNNVR